MCSFNRLSTWLAAVALSVAGCGRPASSNLSEGLNEGTATIPQTSLPGKARDFEGVGGLFPRGDGFVVWWDPIEDEIGDASRDYAYRIYVAFDGQPFDFDVPFLVSDVGASSVFLGGLTHGTLVRVVVQADSQVNAEDVDRNDVSLDGLVARRWYVDDDAAPGGDGTEPALAFHSIQSAVQAAIDLREPGVVLVAGGSYREQVLLPGAVHVYGSFDAEFVVQDRQAFPTVLVPPPGIPSILKVPDTERRTLVDGLNIDGEGLAKRGVRVGDSDLQLSNCAIASLIDEGISSNSKNRPSELHIRRVQVSGCLTEGLDARGSLDCELTACRFTENGKEGAEFNNLSVQKAGSSRLWVRDCVFSQNGNDGLDVDLNEIDPEVGGTSLGGRIDLLIERSRAIDNVRRGFLIDIDYEEEDEITTTVILRENQASRQGEDGISLDVDATSVFLLVGNRSSANGGRGVLCTSGSNTATVTVANHWEYGSTLEGVGLYGPVVGLLSHLAVTGSSTSSVIGNGASVLANGALWLSGPPVDIPVNYSYADVPLDGLGNLEGAPQVLNAPRQMFPVGDASVERDRFFLPEGQSLLVGSVIELRDDGVSRQVLDVVADEVIFAPPALSPLEAGSLVSRFGGVNVDEDPTLVPASSWRDSGDPLNHDSDGSVTDVGVLGGLLEANRTWTSTSSLPFIVAQLTPTPGLSLKPVDSLRILFTHPIEPNTVHPETIRILREGDAISGRLTVTDDEIEFVPDAPFGKGTIEVQVAGGLQSAAGEPLQLPIRYWITET